MNHWSPKVIRTSWFKMKIKVQENNDLMQEGMMVCRLNNRTYNVQDYQTVRYIAEAKHGIIVTQTR